MARLRLLNGGGPSWSSLPQLGSSSEPRMLLNDTVVVGSANCNSVDYPPLPTRSRSVISLTAAGVARRSGLRHRCR